MRLMGLLLLFCLSTLVSCAGDLESRFLKAAASGNVMEVNRLVEQGAQVNAKTDSGWTALMIASRDGHLDMVKALVEKGADVNLKDNEGNSALTFAKRSGNAEIIQLLERVSGKPKVQE